MKHGQLFDTKNLLTDNGKTSKSSSNDNESPKIDSKDFQSLSDFSGSWLTPNFDQLKSLQKILLSKLI